MDTISQMLEEAAQEHGPRLALKMRRGLRLEKYTYQDLWRHAQCTAGFLQNRGMEKGERVLLWAPNSPSWVIAYLGVLIGGGVVVPLDVQSTPNFVANVVAQTEPILALLSTSIPEAARPLSVSTIHLENLPYLFTHGQVVFQQPHIQGQDLAEIMYTSGTTGEPKGVMLTHRNLVYNVETGRQMIPVNPESKALSLLPLSHIYAQFAGLLSPLHSGASIIYLPSRQPNILLRVLRREGITTVALVPQLLQLIMSHIERGVERRGRADLWRFMHRLAPRLPMAVRRILFRSVHRELGGCLQFLLCGGAYLDPGLAQKWENLGIPILQGYGMTETAAMVTYGTLSHRRLGTVGQPPPGQQVAIAPDGEILVRGENVFTGYWRNANATEQSFRNGWYCTGDLGYLDSDGYLHFKGRKKNLIVLADGMNVYPEDIENCLNLRPEIKEAVVIDLPQNGGLVEVHAVILTADPENVAQAVRDTNRLLAPHQQVRGFTVWSGEDFPRTHTLKVKRHEVMNVLGADEKLVEVKPEIPSRRTDSDLRHLVAKIAGLPPEKISTQSVLGLDLGLDSLSIVELLCLIEEQMSISVEEGQLPAQATVGDLEALLADVEMGEEPTNFPDWPAGLAARATRILLQRVLVDPLLAFLCPTQVKGLENLADICGPVLFIANHTSHLDTPVMLKALSGRYGSRLSAAAAADYWFTNPLLGNLTALLFNAFPMARQGNARPSMEHIVDLVDRGWSVLIFPEGTRSPNGELQPFKAGVGLLAVELGIPIVPIQLCGLHTVLPKGSWVPRRGPVEVTIAAPLRFLPGMDYVQATQQLEREICRLSA
jgi:long-chain acyl-CoA synthetase